jgi:hypothetical protein
MGCLASLQRLHAKLFDAAPYAALPAAAMLTRADEPLLLVLLHYC